MIGTVTDELGGEEPHPFDIVPSKQQEFAS